MVNNRPLRLSAKGRNLLLFGLALAVTGELSGFREALRRERDLPARAVT